MTTISKQLVAADVMQRDIVAVSPHDTLRDALALMTDNHVTGLPVVDARSRCIGMVTASDILNYEEENSDGSEEIRRHQFFDPDTQQWETLSMSALGLDELGHIAVSEVMSRDLVWIDRKDSLKDVARRMIDERVHRVLVMDQDSNLYGIVSTVDIVRLVAES